LLPSIFWLLTCLLLDLWFVSSNPVEVNAFLRAIKIRCTTSPGGKVKPSVLCRKIFRHIKEPCEVWRRYFVGKIHGHFSPSFSCIATRCVCCILPDCSDE
jgi:hypothetical protein